MLLSVFSTVFISIILILNNSQEVCGHSSDACDWVGSGLQQEQRGASPPGVQPLYLRCERGRVEWRYPRGALRALLRPPRLRRFRGCVRLAPNSTGARLFLEGEGRLFPLSPRGAPAAEEPLRCFSSSRGGRAALYLEADPPLDPLRRDVVAFSYDLVPQENLADDMEECRPCSDDEILEAYCTSDFIVQGTVTSLSHRSAAETSELTVRATAVRRDSPPGSWRDAKHVTLHRPLKCGTGAGQGEFLFLGRWRLSRAAVLCAPRLHHWKEIRQRALAAGSNQCRLD